MGSGFIQAAELQQAMLERRIVVLRALMTDPISGEADIAHTDFLPGAINFDLDGPGSDHASGLPHTMPNADALARYLGELGVSSDSEVVIYENRGLFCAPRVWWMLKAVGHQQVKVLDGGLPAWKSDGLPVNPEAGSQGINRIYTPAPEPHWFVGHQAVTAALTSTTQIVDARSAPRFNGLDPDPRPGVRAGHMPGAINIPYVSLLFNQRLKPRSELLAIFAEAKLDLTKPIICSCGSGVTACVVAMAAKLCGAQDVAVYDGSWAEWGANNQFPLETFS